MTMRSQPTLYLALALPALCVALASLEAVHAQPLATNETGPAPRTRDMFEAGISLPKQLFFIAVFLCSGTLAAAAGVGGGAIYTPLFIICFDLIFEAIPLSKATVFGAAVAFLVGNLRGPRPSGYATFFAYDVCMIMEPTTLLGTVFGVLVARMSPYWLITAAMAILLAFSARKTFIKGHKKATEERAKALSLRSRPAPTTQALSEYGSFSVQDTAIQNSARNDNSRALLVRCLWSVGLCYTAVLLLSLMTGGANGMLPSSLVVTCGTKGFWLLHLATAFLCATVTISNAMYLRRRARRVLGLSPRGGLYGAPGATIHSHMAVDWTSSAVYAYPTLCLAAGFMSSMVGIGGSTIKGPILLHMGLNPTMAKATSQVMLLTTVSSSMFQFWLRGMLPPQYGMVFFLVGFISGLAGKSLIDAYVRRKGRPSVIIFLLAFYIVVAALTMTSIGAMLVYGQIFGPAPSEAYRNSELWFRSLCSPLPSQADALTWVFRRLEV